MKEKVFLKMPDPFTPAEHAAFTRRVMEMAPQGKPLLRPWFAMAALIMLTIGLALVFSRHPLPVAPAGVPVRAANPLDLLRSLPSEGLQTANLEFPPAPALQKMDVQFRIDKTDHQVRIAWQEMEGYQYIVQKCVLSANGKVCETKTVVHGSAYQENAQEEPRLVLYTVEAVKS